MQMQNPFSLHLSPICWGRIIAVIIKEDFKLLPAAFIHVVQVAVFPYVDLTIYPMADPFVNQINKGGTIYLSMVDLLTCFVSFYTIISDPFFSSLDIAIVACVLQATKVKAGLPCTIRISLS